jgi:hypothetical protein
VQQSIAPREAVTGEAASFGWRYPIVAAHYGRAVAAHLGKAVVITKKWQDVDLVWPHSDIDLRIVLDRPPADWLQVNRMLAQVQRELVTGAPVLRRILEHPPGWIFLRRELEAGLVPPAEVATWSHCFGDPDALRRWLVAARIRPWSEEDERFYAAIIAARIDGAYRLEADAADNVVCEAGHYEAHCISWHYLAPVVFAAASLSCRRRVAGKSAALRGHHLADVAGFLSMARGGYRGAPDRLVLTARADRAVDAVARPLRHACSGMGEPSWAEIVSAVGTMRCRIARYLYYLSPPARVATEYLIERETKDLHGAAHILRAALQRTAEPLRSRIRCFLELIPPPPTTGQSLRRLLDAVLAEPCLVQDLFSTDLVAAGSAP